MHLVVFKENIELIQLLIQSKTDVNLQNNGKVYNTENKL